MIKLYIKNNCPECREAEERFRELVLAHKTVNVENEETGLNINLEELPVIEDEGKIIKGDKQISEYFDSMENYISEWYKFQSDVCYVDENGDLICS